MVKEPLQKMVTDLQISPDCIEFKCRVYSEKQLDHVLEFLQTVRKILQGFDGDKPEAQP